ncbi:hypothetical protein CEE44_03605 [Candidatus Woesearchaeota archaeon B3_Woes]|nr:MAG: hypothetical protein CEE44_03605 [Candidatus Woesearchaeota archaeon B3_Woes]
MNQTKLQTNNLKQSFELLTKSPFYLAIPILLDLIFLFLVGFIGSIFTTKAIPYLQNLATIQSTPAADTSAMIAQQTQLASALTHIVLILLQIVLVVFILWTIFQGINWFLATKCVKKKVNIKKYSLNFLTLNIIWIILIAILAKFFFEITLKNLLTSTPIVSQSLVNAIGIIISIILLYFLFIGYSISYKYKLKEFLKNIFKIGIKDFKIIIAYLIIVVSFWIAKFIVQLFSLSFASTIIAGIIILMPLITFYRIYLIKTIEKN